MEPARDKLSITTLPRKNHDVQDLQHTDPALPKGRPSQWPPGFRPPVLGGRNRIRSPFALQPQEEGDPTGYLQIS